ncbi:MAG: hypothetical protein EXR71_09830 [Myxococcales bacterium]|nr:hypothetical protein [Myxococcales bacterium]
MSEALGSALIKGITFAKLQPRLAAASEGGKGFSIRAEDRVRPYLDHVVEAWTDGPPSSDVAFVLSGKDPTGRQWRRFTLSRVGPWAYELGVFPTPFHNADDPLAPGVPPTSSRRR